MNIFSEKRNQEKADLEEYLIIKKLYICPIIKKLTK